jgi:hypothetical protein
LALEVSIPAVVVIVCVIFVDPCLVKRTKLFRQPSGSDEGAGDDHATGQPKAAQGANDPIASGLPRMAVRGRLFLSEHANDNRIRYYKGEGGRVKAWQARND